VVDDDHAPAGPRVDRRRQFDRADGGGHLDAVAFVDAQRGCVVGMDNHLVVLS
jgi:hypothetical protein